MRQAGARVGTNIMVRDMDLLPQDHQDGRRLVKWWRTAVCRCSSTLVSLVSRDGRFRRKHPEVTGQVGRARLVVFVGVAEGGSVFPNESGSQFLISSKKISFVHL